jgi:hypothetical protein
MPDGVGEFEKKALQLLALNLAFESARPGTLRGELMGMAEEIGEKAGAPTIETTSSGPV